MKASEVYLRAAELIGTLDYRAVPIIRPHYAVLLVCGYPTSGQFIRGKLRNIYADMFGEDDYIDGIEHARISLCLMSAIAAWDESQKVKT